MVNFLYLVILILLIIYSKKIFYKFVELINMLAELFFKNKRK